MGMSKILPKIPNKRYMWTVQLNFALCNALILFLFFGNKYI